MLTAAKIMLDKPNSVEEIPAIWPEKGYDVRSPLLNQSLETPILTYQGY